MSGLTNATPVGALAEHRPRGLGSSIGMTVVISTSQKNQAPELLPRPDPDGGGTSARAAISIYIIAAIAPVKLRERFAV
jgi:hypothetical protein